MTLRARVAVKITPAIVASLLLAAGCADNSDPEAPSVGSSGDEGAQSGKSDPVPTASAGAAPGQSSSWDPQAWEPTVQITPPEFTDVELQNYHQQKLESGAQALGSTQPPEVTLIRWSEGSVEYASNMTTCLQDAGFPAVQEGQTYYFDPGVHVSQEDSLSLASYVCDGQYMMHPVYGQGWSDSQAGLVYDYWVEYYIPCMRANGHNIQDNEKPSRESYVSAFNSGQRISWWPNEWSQRLPADERETMEAVCPQYPPDAVLYGQ